MLSLHVHVFTYFGRLNQDFGDGLLDSLGVHLKVIVFLPFLGFFPGSAGADFLLNGQYFSH